MFCNFIYLLLKLCDAHFYDLTVRHRIKCLYRHHLSYWHLPRAYPVRDKRDRILYTARTALPATTHIPFTELKGSMFRWLRAHFYFISLLFLIFTQCFPQVEGIVFVARRFAACQRSHSPLFRLGYISSCDNISNNAFVTTRLPNLPARWLSPSLRWIYVIL